MSSEWGQFLRISIFGESHGPAIGVCINGLPAGERIDMVELTVFLTRRAPGNAEYATTRREADTPEILSGMLDGRSTGAPLAVIIRNTSQNSADYDKLKNIPRPGHADYTAALRYRGFQDGRGSGHFSGRLTAPLCIAGGIALQVLRRRGIEVGAHLKSVGDAVERSYDPVGVTAEELRAVAAKSFPTLGDGELMRRVIACAKHNGDSVGGVIECCAVGIPGGWGSPMFDGVENRFASLLFGIPAVRGVEFGAGFAASSMRGSENNDAWMPGGKTRTNNHGGILGGITSGMPLIVRVAIKPTPSIALEQDSVDLRSDQPAKLSVRGRHDPCIAPRAVPVVEAAVAVALLDLALEASSYSLP